MESISAKYIDMPKRFKGFSTYDVNNEYTIVINQNITKEEQEQTYQEELSKITKGLYVEEILRSAY